MSACSNATDALKLASAGKDVKVWDSTKYSMCYSFGLDRNTSFRSVHWSSDFAGILSTPTTGSSVLLTTIKGASLGYKELDSGTENTVAKFGNVHVRYLGIGTKIGKVLLWDLKLKKAIKVFFGEKSQVNCLHFNWNDSVIATGLSSGNIILLNNTTGQSSAPFPCAPDEPIQSLQYSYAKKYLLGCAADDGSVYLWDTNSKKLTASFRSVHVARATGISFSPTNNLLFTSVGLDKNLICYDTQSKKPVRTIECEVPLTCVDFKEDGVTLAVGTMRGSVLFFDLRNLVYPLQTVPAHAGPVNCLCFQSTILATAMKNKRSKMNAVSKSDAKLVDLTGNSEVESNADNKSLCSTAAGFTSFDSSAATSGAVATEEKSRGSLTSEIFSPLGDPSENSPNPVPGTSSVVGASTSNVLMNRLRKSFARDNSMALIFSPVGDSNANHSKFSPVGKLSFLESPGPNPSRYSLPNTCSAKKPDVAARSSLQSKLVSPVSDSASSRWPNDKPSLAENANCMPDLSCITLRGICSSKNSAQASESVPTENQNLLALSPDSPVAEPVTVIPPSLDDLKTGETENTENNGSAVNGLGVQMGDLGKTCGKIQLNGFSKDNVALGSGDFVDEGRGTSVETTPMTPEAFQAENIRQMILDAMEEHTDSIRQDFHAYHVQMSRQLERQKEELEELFKKYSIDTDLLSEVVSLKKENNFLKHIFR